MKTPSPKVCLYAPDGTQLWYQDCVINDSLIPDLSFEGTDVITERRVRIVTSLAYLIVRDPVEHEAGLRVCDAMTSNVVPWRPSA